MVFTKVISVIINLVKTQSLMLVANLGGLYPFLKNKIEYLICATEFGFVPFLSGLLFCFWKTQELLLRSKPFIRISEVNLT